MFRSCITGLHVFTGYPGDDDTPCTPGCCRRHDLCYQQRHTDKRLSCSQRGRVLGLSTAATYVGLSAGPVAGGFLNHYVGWRSIFAAAFLVSAAAFLASRRHIPNDRQAEDSISFDISGNILYICAIGMSLYGLSNLSEGIWAWAAFAAGIGAGAGFFLYEKGRKQPSYGWKCSGKILLFLLKSGGAAQLRSDFCHKLSDEHISAGGNGFHIAGCRPYTDMYAADPGGIFSGHGKTFRQGASPQDRYSRNDDLRCSLAMFSFIDEDTGLWSPYPPL